MTYTENDLYEQIAQYLNLKYPSAIYHFDLSGLYTPSHKARNLYGRLNTRAFPDLIIYETRQYFAGLAIEIKREGTVLYKKDGSLRASKHVREQAEMLKQLQLHGYDSYFGVGYAQVCRIIDNYFKL